MTRVERRAFLATLTLYVTLKAQGLVEESQILLDALMETALNALPNPDDPDDPNTNELPLPEVGYAVMTDDMIH